MHGKRECLLFALLLGFFLPSGVSAAPAGETGMVAVEPGVDLFYRKLGSGPETLVVILHAESLVDDLAPLAEGRTVIFYSPRGRGRSSRIDAAKVSFENEFRDLEAVRRHFKLEKMSLLGWSHYGMMTAQYAIRHPERVSRLIQMTPAAPRSDPYQAQAQAEMTSRIGEEALADFRKKRESGVFKDDPVEECRVRQGLLLPASVGDRSAAQRIPLDDCELPNEQVANQVVWWKALYDSVGAYDLRTKLRGLKVPRLVIAGDKDFIPMAASREWVEGMPEARLLVLQGVGHYPHVEAREALNGALKTFLAEETGMVTSEPGVDLYYRKIGSGAETLVVILVAESLVEDLAPLAEGRTVIFYYPRGRGRSSRIDAAKVAFENDFKDLEAVRRHFRLEKMALLGWSHYGMMTARYAMRHPERVTRLIQMTPAAPRRDPYLEQGMAGSGRGWMETPGASCRRSGDSGAFKDDPAAECRAFRKVTLPASFGDPAAAERIRLDDCDLPNEQLANQDVWWKAMFESVGTYDVRSELRGLKVPRLVIAGGKDFIPMAASREWVEGMPEARLLVLPGAGHFPHVEAREALIAALKTFLDGGLPAGAEAGTAAQELKQTGRCRDR